jgi:hypothetical protein
MDCWNGGSGAARLGAVADVVGQDTQRLHRIVFELARTPPPPNLYNRA